MEGNVLKPFNARISHKHDIEAHWQLATGFSPLAGELIIYDPDDTHQSPRFKIGDSKTNVNDLPFANENELNKIDINSADTYVNVGVDNISSDFNGVRIRKLTKNNDGTVSMEIDNQNFIIDNFVGQQASIFINN
jgi:hypothetical protein